MNPKPRHQADSTASQGTGKKAEVPQHGDQSLPSPKGSGADLKPPFATLAKDFDAHPKGPSGYPTSLDIPEHESPSEASSNRGDQQNNSGQFSLERPWAGQRHGQAIHTGNNPALNENSNTSPLSTWETEAPIDGPYHAIASVANDQTTRPTQALSHEADLKDSEGIKAGTQKSSGGRRG